MDVTRSHQNLVRKSEVSFFLKNECFIEINAGGFGSP